jgi:exodeoxyribonuclease III
MRVLTLNVNGIRAAARHGFFDWLPQQRADVVCLQEIRAHEAQLGDEIFRPRGLHCHYLHAQRGGYSGVAVYSRRRPDAVIRGLTHAARNRDAWHEFDSEARYLELRFGALSVVSLYLPSGSSGEARQQAKFRFLERFMPYLERLHRRRRDYVLCGDWNIAHKNIDLENWRGNQKNSGFLPQERAWMDELFGRVRYVDAFRAVDQRPRQYTWWSNRGRAWEKNVGWRIDYQIVSPALASTIERASIYKSQRFSDHAPLTIDYALSP